MRRPAWLILALFFFVAGVGTWQYVVFARESARLKESLDAARATVALAEDTARRLAEFRREVESTRERVSAARRLLPTSLDAEGFLATVTEWASGSRVAIQGYRHRIQTHEETGRAFDEATLTVTLKGPPSALRRLSRRKRAFERARFIRWGEEKTKGDELELTLSIFSAPEDPASPRTDPCGPFKSRVWLPPLSRWLADMDEERALWCQKLRELPTLLRYIEVLEADRRDYAYRLEILDSLKKR